MRRLSFSRFLLAVLILVVSLAGGFVANKIGSYFDHLDAFSGHIARQDQSTTRDELRNLEYFHHQNYRLKSVWLSWVAEKYIFEDISCQRAAYYNLIKDFEKTIDEELKNKKGFCASFLRGNARWRQAQAIYASALNLPDKTVEQTAEKEKQLKIADQLTVLAKGDYQAALKANPSHSPSSWNYDLLLDQNAKAAGLGPKSEKIKIKLGQELQGGKLEPGPLGEEGEEGKGEKSKDINTQQKGPGRPGDKPRRVG